METVKLSSKGQIVIPKNIRDNLHLPPGTEFVISMTATGLTLTPTTLFPRVTAREVRGFLAKRGRQIPDDVDIKASIKARLKAQDDASK
ncbi:AbrB/MazE/SpoVT family DNA-binding domain-containing protein [Noviherbaspirillum sedimenti]|uniref:AbrB/MazE/SpoVT family DNA-binding domain-containing protein n=1 Tax=Noviherbaspirillum sedimenti TaxID=2320865 RepID=A0A3A3G3N2_9BURK|nr:AbrB/MazE/SpoVT family DNA-binding domain-containing protein [Noviherbaspirillum sedimenti]RJG02275.1 AbrB/MazE/SpoVT family DNA-binding domain-containing protein [Noviherbaspirillum sedimenti]